MKGTGRFAGESLGLQMYPGQVEALDAWAASDKRKGCSRSAGAPATALWVRWRRSRTPTSTTTPARCGLVRRGTPCESPLAMSRPESSSLWSASCSTLRLILTSARW